MRSARSGAATWHTRSRSTRHPSSGARRASTRFASTACTTRRSSSSPRAFSKPRAARMGPWRAWSPTMGSSSPCSATRRSSQRTCRGRAACSRASSRGLEHAATGSNKLLTKEHLAHAVSAGEIDTVVVAFTDMQGRLMGKRVDAEYFVETSYDGESTEGCNYLMTVDMEMEVVPGYKMASWEQGYGDFDMVPDFDTLRLVPWLDATAMVLCDVAWHDRKPVRPSPRQVLRAQIERARKLGFEPMFGSELEFYLLKETFAEAHAKHYIDLTPSVPYILDYHILATTYDEPFIRAVRKGMKAAGIQVESSKGEAGPGQQGINLRLSDTLRMADNDVIYKNGIKEMAHQHGCSVTFMAKPDHRWIGSSCHIHSSLWKGARDGFEGESETV